MRKASHDPAYFDIVMRDFTGGKPA